MGRHTTERPYELRGFWLGRRCDSKNWQICWRPPGTRRLRRLSTQTPDLALAKERLREHVRRRRPGSPDEPLIKDLLDEYVERVMARSRIGWPAEKTARMRWEEFLDRENIVTVADLTLDAQDRYVAWRLERIRESGKKGSGGTLQRELGVMKAALRSAWKRGRIGSVPYVRGAPRPPPRDRTLTAEECRRLLAACEEPHLYRFVLLSLHTLQRPTSILELRAEQIDLERGRIDFLPPGREQTFKRRPVVPIGAAIRPEIERAIAESNRGYIIEYGGRPVASVKKSFATASKRAGLTNIFPYVLRHTGATLLASEGVPLRQIAGMLGHSEQKTTELYAKHRPEYLQEASTTLSRLFTEKPREEIARRFTSRNRGWTGAPGEAGAQMRAAAKTSHSGNKGKSLI